MSRLAWLLLNTLTFAGTLFANYYVNANARPGNSIGDISDRFATLITPADYAFGIWGLIYLGLVVFLAYQWYLFLSKKEDNLKETGIWFAVANLANGLWIISWMDLMLDTSVIIMLLLLLALCQLVIRLKLEIWDAPVRVIIAVWWPFTVYLGWIVLATAVNIAAWLVSTGWTGGPLSETTWAVIILLVAMFVYLTLIYKRNLREASLVGIWGILAIAFNNWHTEASILPYVCIGICVILLIASGYHGYLNRATSPFEKIKRGEF